MDFATKCVKGKCFQEKCNSDRTPVYMNNVYVLGEDNFYVRYSNVNHDVLRKQILSLYGDKTTKCHILPSGMAAISILLDTVALSKGHIIVAKDIYAETKELLAYYKDRLFISFVNLHDLDELKSNICKETRLILLDSLTNPFYNTFDIKTICKIAHNYPQADVKVCVDNSLYTSYYYNPFNDNVDYVVESIGKYTCGYGDALAGAILGLDCYEQVAIKGMCVSPFNCWLLQRSIPTFSIRMDRITETANKVYKFLLGKTSNVLWSGKGGLITFSLLDRNAHKKLVSNLRLILNGYSFGSDETLILVCYKPNTEYNPPHYEDYIRISIGLESAEDIIDDLSQSFDCLEKHID